MRIAAINPKQKSPRVDTKPHILNRAIRVERDKETEIFFRCRIGAHQTDPPEPQMAQSVGTGDAVIFEGVL